MTPHEDSETARLEAFSDGVFAIIITIMVLEFRVPEAPTLEAMSALLPVFLSYILSFIYLAIYWNNHHHLLHAAKGISGGIMWSNMFLLFWLSLIPFGTKWINESPMEALPAASYGVVLFMASFAFYLLQKAILRKDGKTSDLGQAVGNRVKERVSILLYLLAIAGAFFNQWIAYGLFIVVAVMWVIPDKRLAPLFDHRHE
jgi:uncharacterized membrane protein